VASMRRGHSGTLTLPKVALEECSTPGGINAKGTSFAPDPAPPTAWCSTPGGINAKETRAEAEARRRVQVPVLNAGWHQCEGDARRC